MIVQSYLLTLALALGVPASNSVHAAPRTAARTVGGEDCDKDGLSDDEERSLGTELCNADSDGDDLSDFDEVRTYHTNPRAADTDGDGLSDRDEVLTDHTDPLIADSDGDGLSDGEEALTLHSDPLLLDTDGDGLPDGEEALTYGTRPDAADTDGDGLSDGDELTVTHTDPRAVDTDRDGLSDGAEVRRYETDPLAADTDGDLASDSDEVLRLHTDPRTRDSDGDSVIDGRDRCPRLAGTAARGGCPAPPALGAEIAFAGIGFAGDDCRLDTLHAESLAALAGLVAWMEQCGAMSVIVEGHAWREASDAKNNDVSDLCARRVEEWLAAHGVDRNRIEAAIGYGSRKSAPFRTEAKASGRRITVRVARTCE